MVLRPLEMEDVEILQGWINNPEIHQYLCRTRPLNRTEEKEWLENLHKQEGEVVLGIARREGEQLIGTCGLHGLKGPHRTAELGILIGEERFHGQGYGTEAIRLLLAYGFQTLNLHRVGLRVYENNPRAIRCYEKCGFRREGVQRESRWWEGRWWNTLEYAILEKEWRETKPREIA